MKAICKFIIPGAPAIKKNSRVIRKSFVTGKPFLGKSGKLVAAENLAAYELIDQKNRLRLVMIDFPVTVKFSFYLPTRTTPDLSNLYQLPEDALERAGILENDRLIFSHDGSRRFIDTANPRTEIEIFPFAEQ